LKTIQKREFRGSKINPGSRFSFSKPLASLVLIALLSSCSLFKTRPVQEMSDTAAAMKAAKEAQADVIAPVLYREANEWWQKAKAEYKYKNFEQAEAYAVKARKLAEQAEFEVLKNPGQRAESAIVDTPADASSAAPAPAPTDTPYPYPTPTGTPYDRANQPPQSGGDNSSPTHVPVPAPNTP